MEEKSGINLIIGEDGQARIYSPYAEIGIETKEEYDELVRRLNISQALIVALKNGCIITAPDGTQLTEESLVEKYNKSGES